MTLGTARGSGVLLGTVGKRITLVIVVLSAMVIWIATGCDMMVTVVMLGTV
jgi:hypothetical protein